MPMASPRLLPRNATVGCRIRRSTSAGSTLVPSSARPSPRWNRAQRSWSATEDARPPPGFSPRQRRHSRATDSVPSWSRLWPTANRRVMTSSRAKKLCSSPSGSSTSEATALS
jgi:hypothetical protein